MAPPKKIGLTVKPPQQPQLAKLRDDQGKVGRDPSAFVPATLEEQRATFKQLKTAEIKRLGSPEWTDLFVPDDDWNDAAPHPAPTQPLMRKAGDQIVMRYPSGKTFRLE
jgi:hypothetical protein